MLCHLTYNSREALHTVQKFTVDVKDKHSCILGVMVLLCNNPVTVLIRAPAGGNIEDNSKMIFLISQGKHML